MSLGEQWALASRHGEWRPFRRHFDPFRPAISSLDAGWSHAVRHDLSEHEDAREREAIPTVSPRAFNPTISTSAATENERALITEVGRNLAWTIPVIRRYPGMAKAPRANSRGFCH